MIIRLRLLCSACALALCVGDAVAAPEVGVAAAVNQSAEGTPPGGEVRSMSLGDNIIHDERIVTGEVGLVQILLVDGTTFTVGANSDLTIDSFVYDPSAGTAAVAATFSKGVLRFIGGLSSKNGNAVIETPMGTIGIRGGVGVLMIGNRGNPDIPPDVVSCVYGTCSVGQTTIAAGQSAYPDPNNRGQLIVVATPPALAAAGVNALASSSGQTGGATDQPSDEDADQVSEEISDNPASDPSPAYDPITTEMGTPGSDPVDPSDTNPPVTELPAETVDVRVLTATGTFTSSTGEVIENPGDVGLVGGSPENDQSVTVTVDDSGAIPFGAGELQQGEFTLPLFSDSEFTQYALTGVESPFGPLNGNAYSGPGDFAAYMLHVGADATQPFYAITGTPTDFVAVFQDATPDVRFYEFTEDPIQQLPMPFMQDGAIESFEGAAVTDFMVLESPDFNQANAIVFQASLAINGEGVDQQSAVGVNVGAVSELEDGSGDYAWLTGRRGGYRSESTGTSFQSFGGVGTVAGPNGGDQFFGPNGESFVVSAEIAINDTLGDSPADRNGSSDPFSTTHVGHLVDEQPLAERDRNLTALEGFSAGVMEGWAATGEEGGEVKAPVLVMNDIEFAGIRLEFDAERSQIGGVIAVRDTIFGDSDIDYMEVAYGRGIDGNTMNGQSAYVDDATFAARTNNLSSATFLRPEEGADLAQHPDQRSGTYVVSADTVPLSGEVTVENPTGSPDYMGGEAFCSDCDFIKWGWWGTQVRAVDPGDTSEDPAEIRRAGVHLGTWVAGEIADPAELPLGGTATYEGHAVGTVIADTVDGPAQYVAGGDMDMTWDFGNRDGRVDITNFDGHDFGADVQDPFLGGEETSSFTGQVDGLNGTINGAFVNDGPDVAAGVMGNFGVEDTGWSATGIFAGSGGLDGF